MVELFLCSMLTILPDFLFRRFVQGKRLGREIDLFTIWFELRWGITLCLILTLSLITTIFYFHPATKAATSVFRTVTVMPEKSGRVAETFVELNQRVKAGQPLFRLDSTEQEAAAETARRKIAEVEAAMVVAVVSPMPTPTATRRCSRRIWAHCTGSGSTPSTRSASCMR
jgi:hypothetical protein